MSAPAPLSVSAPLPPVVVDSSTVLAALRKAANGAAAGPTTLDCDILLLLCEQKEIMEALTVMVGKMLNNDVGPITKSLVLPRRLIPTGKKDDGVRPISIGESVTKVASIVSLFMLTPDDKRDILGPCQYAYNRPGAAESAVHAVRAAGRGTEGGAGDRGETADREAPVVGGASTSSVAAGELLLAVAAGSIELRGCACWISSRTLARPSFTFSSSFFNCFSPRLPPRRLRRSTTSAMRNCEQAWSESPGESCVMLMLAASGRRA